VRLSIVTVSIMNFFIGFAIWGTDVTVRIAG
jgi:phospholipid/cholesterol/gamma-HCH transport system permease protein